MRMAEENPDIVMEDGFTSLVECKGSAEWGASIKLDKRITGEILFYQDYAETLDANSALFICEGRFDPKEFMAPVCHVLEKAERVAMSTQRYLTKALKDEELRKKLDDEIKSPKDFEPKERILT